ncbi:MAG TPA: hypothetical protein VFY14_20520 [Streptomyces sp.]|nr:hypothetical protein [Streptomyces sp.]
MTTRASRLLPTAVAVLALGLVPACGGPDSADGGGPKEPGEGRAPASGTPARAELEKAVLRTADVPGYTVKALSGEEVSGAGQEKADRAECQPIASVIGGAPRPGPKEMVYRQFLRASQDQEGGGPVLFEMLGAYEQRSADRLLSDLRGAVRACADGFTTRTGDGTTRYSGVRELTAPSGADDALAYRVDGDPDGGGVALLFDVAVRVPPWPSSTR